MPNMADPYFSRTLTYVCEHNEQGALGIVVNRPIDMTLQALFERTDTRFVVLLHLADLVPQLNQVLVSCRKSRHRGCG